MARFCTTYDAAVYSLILALQNKKDSPPYLKCERIGKKNLKFFENDEIGLKFAYLTLISFGEKFRDDVLDDDGLKTRFASKIFRKAIEKSKKAQPLMAQNSFNGTENINKLQRENAPIERVLSAYGDMAVRSFLCFMDLTDKTSYFIRSVSEWVIFVDMICDYDEDYKNGAYNGLKTEGCPTFSSYIDKNYVSFFKLVNSLDNNLILALKSVQDNSTTWNALYKIIMHALDTVIPGAINGQDIQFHYFKDLYAKYKDNLRIKKESKRMGIKNI